jgi:Pyrimidine dimer DNA glycosylase
MRLWSLHPKYLDSKGLVALWREGLLALAVLEGKTKGYVHHPQLERFRGQKEPVEVMKAYLRHIYEESNRRGYHFNPKKIEGAKRVVSLKVTEGQLRYELEHLKQKLKVRNRELYKNLTDRTLPEVHPIFRKVDGEVEGWEKSIK